MKIQVQREAGDDRLIAGFMVATNYHANSGLTQKEWFVFKLREFIAHKARQGDAIMSTSAATTAYVQANKTAMESARAAIPEPVATIN